MKFIFFALLLFILGEAFPTYSASNLVNIYTKISKFQQSIALDFLDNKDDLSIVKLTLEQIFTNNLESSRISILFQLINWITNFFEKIAIANLKPDFRGQEVEEFHIYNKFRNAALDFIKG